MGNIEKGEKAAVYHRKKSADADMTYMEQVQALETKMGKRFSESEIIMIDKVKAQIQGANAEKDIPYGYQENKDTGEIEAVGDRAEKVKIIYEKLLDYSEHPPKELVEAKIEDAWEVRREKLTYEEAEKEVTLGEILEYIAKELGKKQETDKKESVPIMYGKKKDCLMFGNKPFYLGLFPFFILISIRRFTMNNTALGAENKKKQTISFISEAHEKFYYEKLKEVRYQDV